VKPRGHDALLAPFKDRQLMALDSTLSPDCTDAATWVVFFDRQARHGAASTTDS